MKSDALDAFGLADLLRRQAAVWRPLRLPSETLSELQALVRDRERFVIEHRRLQHLDGVAAGGHAPGDCTLLAGGPVVAPAAPVAASSSPRGRGRRSTRLMSWPTSRPRRTGSTGSSRTCWP